jgi:hypothetical protein
VDSSRQLVGRTAPLACGCALAAAAVLVTAYDPTTDGGLFPACGFHRMTGLWCPGCGLTRATHHLLRGDLAGALSSNAFTPFVLLAIAASWWGWVRWSFGQPRDRLSSWVVTRIVHAPRWSSIALVTIVVGYGVVRNIPASPFSALAP